MLTLQQLREKKNAKAQEANEILNKADYNPKTDGPVYDALLDEIESINADIKRVERRNEALADQAATEMVAQAAERVARNDNKPHLAIYARFLRGGLEVLNDQERDHIRNTMSTTTGSEGGYTVTSEIAKELIEALKAYGGVRAVATVLRQTRGNTMSWPTSDGTSEEGEIVAENTDATAADPTFGTVGITVYKYSSKVVAVPIELLQDSEVDIEAFVRQRLATRIGRITNKHFTIGSGSSQPRGFVTGAGVGKTGASGQTATVLYDDIVDLQHSVDFAYREAGNCVFQTNDNNVRIIRKIKDGQSRPIFSPGYESGAGGSYPDRLLGDRLVVNQHMADMAASAKSIAYGDFSKYIIRDVMDVTLFRFADSAYIKKGQIGFLAWSRHGGNLTDSGAVKVYQNAAS